ncbi:MAG: cytochrome c oxidase subunit II [Magnetococcales bacterium]|nr:cytochrome c oxidase subunit II [Magnetococcales bacterium]
MKGRLVALSIPGMLLPGVVMAAAPAKIVDPVTSWNHLWNEVLIDLFLMGTVFAALAVYWLIKYRATSPDQVGSGPKLSRAQSWAWAMVPAFIFMADDFFLAAKGWTVWNIYRKVPDNAYEIKVTGNMWYWQFEYPNGVTTTYAYDTKEGDGLMVPVGTPVVLRMTSNDVIHSFGMSAYRVKEDMMPGRVTYIWFLPTEEKQSWVTCTEFCGVLHAQMYAPVKAVPRAQFDAWLQKKKSTT